MGKGGRYLAPGWFVRRVANTIVMRLGGASTLGVRGRTSGRVRRVPVNVLEMNGQRYLVSARGDTQWVRNLRAAGGGTLRRFARRHAFTAVKITDADKPPIIAAYRRRWDYQVRPLFEALPEPRQHPVFRINYA